MRNWKDIKFYHGYSYNDIKNAQDQWKEMDKKYNPVTRIRHACIKTLIIIIIIGICAFLLVNAESELDSLHETYNSLDGTENTNSKYSFKKSLEFVYKLTGKEVPISLHTDLGGKPVVDWNDISPDEDDTDFDGEEDTPGTGEVLKPQTNEVKKAVADALRSKGYDDVAIAAVLGNMYAESGWVPGTTQSHTHDYYTNAQCIAYGCTTTKTKGGNAHGLVQWDAGRAVSLITGADKSGREWSDLQYQIEFMLVSCFICTFSL